MPAKRPEGLERAHVSVFFRTGLLTNVAGINLYAIDVDGHRRIMMEVGDDSSDVKLRRAIRTALELRDKLLEVQGPFTRSGANQYIETLMAWKQNGMSYNDLAVFLNARVVELLAAYAEYENDSDNDDWYSQNNSKANPLGLEEAQFILTVLRMRTQEISILLTDGLERVRRGQPPFEAGYPLSREQLISAMKYWRSKRKRA